MARETAQGNDFLTKHEQRLKEHCQSNLQLERSSLTANVSEMERVAQEERIAIQRLQQEIEERRDIRNRWILNKWENQQRLQLIQQR